MDKRYQVFVSSTYDDLREERQEVMNALLELDCIPSGMELFPAANEDQWTVIKQVIEDCDYYIVIVGGRYGSIGPEDMGYTEMEYRYALETKKPIIAFLHKDPESLPAKKTERSENKQNKLENFREFCEQKMCKYWNTPAELGSVVSRSFVQLVKTNPATGWVKADLMPDKDALKEILELKKRIEELENELELMRTKPPEGTEDLAQGKDKFKINYTFVSRSDTFDFDGTSWNATFSATWTEIFSCISPLMIDEASETILKRTLTQFIREENIKNLLKNYNLQDQKVIDFFIKNEDFHTIKVQFRALGLIDKSIKQRSVKDKDVYWTLTPYGDTLMTKLKAIKKPKIIRRRTKKITVK